MAEHNQDQWQDLVTDVDGFWNEETAKEVKGKLVSITNMELARRPTDVAVILLTAPVKGVKGKKDDKEVVDLEPGQAIGVVIKHKLRDLYSMVENQCELHITAKEKISLDNGNTLWRYGVRFRGKRVNIPAPRSENAGAPRASSSGSGDAEKDAKDALEAV